MAESAFTKFVRDLSEHPDKVSEFEKDPRAVMEKAGLTHAEQTLILSGNEELITQALGIETTALRFIFRIRNIRFGV
jgi:hypothetical protein